MENNLKTICSWCLKEQGIPPTKGDSHGICDRHYEIEMEKMDKEERDGKEN